MQVYPINNYQPNFNALNIDKNIIFSQEQEKVIRKIKSTLNLERTVENTWASAIERAEEIGFDIFITKGNDKGSVAVKLSTDYKNKKGEVVFTDYINVGEYSSKEPFNMNAINDILLDIESDPKNMILNCLLFGAAITFVALSLLCFGKLSKTSSSGQQLKILKERTVDTLNTNSPKTIDITKMIFKQK